MNAIKKPLTVTDSASLLAIVPHQLGVQPQECLVLLPVGAGRLIATLRVDLPRGGPVPHGVAATARRAVGYLDRIPALDRVFAVVYSSGPDDAGGPPHRALVDAVGGELARRGIELPEAWHVGAQGYRGYGCTDADCCPPRGRPLSSIVDSEANARLVFGGSAPLRAWWSGEAGPWPALETVREAVDSILAGTYGRPDPDLQLLAWCRLLKSEPAAVLADLRAEPVATARHLAALADPDVRDRLLYCAATGRLETGHDCSEVAEMLSGFVESPPDWALLDRLWEIGRGLADAARDTDREAVLTLVAWIEWARGRSSAADALLSRPDAGRPDRLATLLDVMLQRGVLPPWAQDPSAAWKEAAPRSW
ncbi:DUF4192 family protein [Zafaria sp. J156]|uniref:DUF4192 family protein n=1 Tax=Zafaria sp. J156 TaxID=3116490 RepID=UPI002E799BB0|nr:DUF4192 family protein [Zafaria sp. J156]MEE1620252.1 DUF4192 family protein [Zafaria sp. J156]